MKSQVPTVYSRTMTFDRKISRNSRQIRRGACLYDIVEDGNVVRLVRLPLPSRPPNSGVARPSGSNGAGRKGGSWRRLLAWAWRMPSSAMLRWRRLRHEIGVRRQTAALAALDDRALGDLGVAHRSQIEALVRSGRPT